VHIRYTKPAHNVNEVLYILTMGLRSLVSKTYILTIVLYILTMRLDVEGQLLMMCLDDEGH
jgi:hypothetical protein